MIRKATEKDISAINEIYQAIHTEEERGSMTIGWKRDIYPTRETAERAVSKGEMFVMENDGVIIASGRINQEQEPQYKKVNWMHSAEDHEVLVLHTLVVDPKNNGKGHGRAFISFYEQMAQDMGCTCLRIDTNERNAKARRLYQSLGYREAGIVLSGFNGIANVPLVCLEKSIKA